MSKKIIKVISLFLTFLLIFGTLPLNVVFAEGVDDIVNKINIAAESKQPDVLWNEMIVEGTPIPTTLFDFVKRKEYCEYISDKIIEKGEHLTLEEIISAVSYVNENVTEIKAGVINDIMASVAKEFTVSKIGAITVPQDVKNKIRATKTGEISAEWTRVEGDAVSHFTLENSSLILTSRPVETDLDAKIVLTLNNAGTKVDFVYTITIEKYADDNEKVLDTLTFDVIKGENHSLDNINKNLNLVTSYQGKTVSWTSSNLSVISNDGKVTQPVYWGNTEILTLTAKIGSYTKVFNAVVNPTRFNQYTELKIENDGFEKVGFTSIPNWTRMEGTRVDSGVFENSTDKVFDGNYSLKLDERTTDVGVGMFNGGALNVQEGHRYIGETMVYLEEGASASMMIMFFDMNSIQVGFEYSSLVGAKGGWQILRCEATAPRGAVMVRIYPMLNPASTAPVYLDNARIYEMPMLHNANFVPADIDATWFPANGKLTSTTATAFAGVEYVFTGNASEATTAAVNFYDSNGIIVYTYTKDVLGNFDVRAIAPAEATTISVTLGTTNKSIFSNLALNMSPKGTQIPDGSFESYAETEIPSWLFTTTTIATEKLTFFENGGFEEDIIEWTPTSASTTFTLSNEKAASGNYSGKIVATGPSTGVRSTKFDIIPGKEYTINFKAQTTSAAAQFYIEWWDAAGSRIDTSNFSITSDVFKEQSVTKAAPINAVQMSLRPYFLSSAQTGGTIYIDDISVFVEGMQADNGYLLEKDFEGTFVDDFTTNNANITITQTTEKVASGSYAGKVVATAAGTALRTQYVDVVAGEEYTFQFKAQSTDPTAKCYIEWRDANDNYAAEGTYPGYSILSLQSNSFKEHVFTMKAPSGAVKARMRLYFVNPDQYNVSTDRTVYIDDIYIKTNVESASTESYAKVNGDFVTDGLSGLALSYASANSLFIPVLSGKDYAFVVDTKCDTVDGAKATINYYDSKGNLISSESVTNTKTGNEMLKLTTTAPTMSFNASIKLETEEVAYFDNARIYMVADTIGNPSFENTNPYKPGHHATQWQSHGGVIARTYGSTELPDGALALEIKGTVGGSVNSSMIRVDAGTDYTARIKASSKQGGSFRLSFYDANFKCISSSNATSFTGEEWVRYSVNGKAPIGTTYAVVEILANEKEHLIVDNTEFFTTTANIDDKTQMFIDDYIIKDISGIDRTFHQAEISDPIMEPTCDFSQVHSGQQIYGSCIYDEDEKIYKLWYTGSNKMLGAEFDYLSALACYAISKDGINWEYPSLGIFEYRGSKDNNIFGNYHIPSVFKDYDEPDPEKRYKMISYHHTGTHYSYFYSADGLHWTNAGEVSKGFDVINAAFDKTNNQYISIVKNQINKRNQWTVVDDKDFNVKSYVMANTLADLIDAQNCYRPDSYGQGMYEKDGVYVGFDWLFSIPGTYAMEGPINTKLTFSRDLTEEWQRPTRTTIVPIKEVFNYSNGCTMTASYAIESGDEIWLYVSGSMVDHAAGLTNLSYKKLHLAKWRMDGFASLDSGNNEGVITTRPLSFSGKALNLNANADGGSIKVELLDASGNPISGYTKDDCDVITTDSISHTVSWNGNNDVSALANEGVSVRIYSENSEVYSFKFGEATSTVYIEDEATGETNFVGSFTEGDEVTLPENTNTREGYAFAGWKVGEEVLKAGDTFTVSGNTTISAVWNLYGDFDGDDKVDAKETAMVREHLIGKENAKFIKEFADVNTDGDVDICDLVAFIKNLK